MRLKYSCLVPPVDCEWNDWLTGECSQTCGGGLRINTRTKKTEESNGGVCEGEATMQEECSTHNCPCKFLKKYSWMPCIYYN